MDKKLFELQVRHNYFIRFTVVSICKIMIASFIYICFLYAIAAVWGIGLQWAQNGTWKPAVYTDKVNGAVICTIIIVSVLYIVFWISTIIKIISQHKVVTHIEKKVYKNVDKGYYESEIFHDHEPVKKVEENNEEEL